MRALQFVLAALIPTIAHAETCRFHGTTTHAGHLAVTATTSESDGLMTIDVTLAFAIAALTSDVTYLGEERTTWRAQALQSLAVNQRTLIDGAPRRQQWDVFRRVGPRLEAYRVEAKRLPDFRRRHPGFTQHWSPATFAQPWLADFPHAPPDRRPDLDLPAASVFPPLAFAFYWTRFLPDAGEQATIVLPGFKRAKQVPLRLSPALPGPGWRRWSTPLLHTGLNPSPPSLAAAWVSPQHYLLQLGLEIHTTWASGQALLRPQGCQGVQIRPEELTR